MCLQPNTKLLQRRRTQIRLAQRAYRQRKETTIASLNQRVRALQKTIEQMNQGLMNFQQKAMFSGIQNWSPALTEELQTVKSRFSELALKDAALDNEDDEQVLKDGTENRPANKKRRSGSEQDAEDYAAKKTNPNHQTSAGQQQLNSPQLLQSFSPSPKSMWGYDMIYEAAQGQHEDYDASTSAYPSLTHSQPPAVSTSTMSGLTRAGGGDEYFEENPTQALLAANTFKPQSHDEVDSRFMQFFQIGNIGPAEDFQIPTNPIGKSLPLPPTLSFQEQTFARRLLRRAYEHALRLFNDPNADQEEINRMCKFTFCWTNREMMLKHLQRMVQSSSAGTLELWTAPQLHIGGSGLHYPRNSLDVKNPPPSWWKNRAPVGPWPLWQAETPKDPSMSIEQVVESIGYGGEWFDASDVEQYLREKGIHLDGNSSVVEIKAVEDIPPLSSPSEDSIDSSGGPTSPHHEEPLFNDESTLMQSSINFWDTTLNPSSLIDPNMNFSFAEDTTSKQRHLGAPWNTNDFLGPMPRAPKFSARKVVDVEKFIDSAFLEFIISTKESRSLIF